MEGDGFAEGSRKVQLKTIRNQSMTSDGSEGCEYGGCRVEKFSILGLLWEKYLRGRSRWNETRASTARHMVQVGFRNSGREGSRKATMCKM